MEGKVRAAGCLRLELVGDAAAAVMDVAEAELAAAGAALADLAFVAVQVHQQNRVVDVIDSPWRYAHRSRGREATRVAVRERRPSVSRLHNSKLPSE